MVSNKLNTCDSNSRTRFVVNGFRLPEDPFFAGGRDTETHMTRCGGPGCVSCAGYSPTRRVQQLQCVRFPLTTVDIIYMYIYFEVYLEPFLAFFKPGTGTVPGFLQARYECVRRDVLLG